jgi:hypothetical protein
MFGEIESVFEGTSFKRDLKLMLNQTVRAMHIVDRKYKYELTRRWSDQKSIEAVYPTANQYRPNVATLNHSSETFGLTPTAVQQCRYLAFLQPCNSH